MGLCDINRVALEINLDSKWKKKDTKIYPEN